jgi:hypothetical protein
MTRPTIGLLLTLVLSLLVAPLAADAQPPTNVGLKRTKVRKVSQFIKSHILQ